MPQTLSQKQVIDSMIEFVRAHLQLEDRKEKEESQSLVFSGVREEDTPHRKTVRNYRLDIITKVDSAAYPSLCKRRLAERKGKIGDRIYTAILIPRSVDYHNADPRFEGPYLRTAALLKGLDEDLVYKYKDKFLKDPIAILSDLETEIAIPLTDNNVAYYNPNKGAIQVFRLIKFPWRDVIPFNENTPGCKLTSYDEKFLRAITMSDDSLPRTAESIFFNKQKHLHRVVRKVVKVDLTGEGDKENIIDGDFTLSPYKTRVYDFYGARLIPSNQNQ